MRGRGPGAGRRLVSRASRIRSSRRAATLLIGLALLASSMLRPEEVLADLNVIPSGAGTIVIGPQAMEGNLQVQPGDPLKAGFDFTMPGTHPAAQVTVENGSVRIAVKCSNGTTPSPIALNLRAQTIGVTANSAAWYPSGNQSDPSVYQGSLAAPDLCGGGVMSAAAGATFTATVSSTDTTDALNFRFHYSDNTSGSWSATKTALPVPFAETLPTVQLTPSLGLTLGVDKASAIPGDMLTYASVVTNTGATLALAGDLIASNTGGVATTVASYWNDLATSLDGSQWTPFAGTAAAQPGYTPAVAPPITGGMSLAVTPVAAGGVTYPSGGDLVLGTSIAPGSTALWHYTASLPLTPSQVGVLLNPGQVKRVRASIHVEVSPPNPNVTQPAVMSIDFTQELLGASPAPTGAVSNATVSIQPPQGAAPLQFSSATSPGLASIAPGASVTVSGASAVQVVAARAADESDSAYLQRLAATEGSALTASATASGTGWSGQVSSPSPAPTASTTEHLPIVGIAKSGPATADAGTTASYPLTLTNGGGATAGGLSIIDSLPGGATGTVSGVPASLAPGAGGTATASYTIPGSQPAGSLADTAAVSWQDANGNAYGPVSSSFTTMVTNTLSGASLTLAPQASGPDVVGQSQQLTATLLDRSGSPIANQGLTFSITGANPTTAPATTDASGQATFSYVGASAGTDLAQATASSPGVNLQSNTASVSWVKPIQTVSMTPVQGNFFHEPSSATSFVAKPGDTPDFAQAFPTIDFNPPVGTVPHNISNVTNLTRPFTDLTTDVNGNFNGTIVAQGSGLQAGVGTMSSFDAELAGTMVAAEAGDVTFDLQVGDGFILGVGGGASRVSGDLTNPPASDTSAFQGYPLIAAFQAQSATATRTATVHFPAPGTYPFEIDYFDCCDGDLSLTMTAASIVPQTSPLSIYVGYADGLRPGGAAFPFPWIGSPGTTFVGETNAAFDSGAIRFDNSSDSAITLDQVTVDVGPTHLDLWPRDLTVSAHQTLILAQTFDENFDSSDYPSIQCNGNDGIIPKVNVTVAGTVTSYPDTHQVLNTGGFDFACRGNESTAWQRIAGVSAAIDLPVPPAVMLNLSPFSVPGATVGLAQQLSAAAMDASGVPVANLPLTVQVFGANPQQLSATTDASGLATFSYAGSSPGTDQVQVSGFVSGFRAISNLASVTWANPLQPGPGPQPSSSPPPSVSNASPADGAIVTKPVPIDASITPPAGQAIGSWQVTYQAQDAGPLVTLASGTGTPPSPLATFDPTQLPNDSYQINITAVASNGVFQTLATTVTVFGNLKLGRYVTTYQDLSVPVNGFQMEVRRRYDSIDKAQGDFGVGWRVDVVNFRTTPNRQLGAGGWSMYDSSCFFGLCLTAFKSSVPHYVSVTFPDHHTEIFDFTPTGGTNLFWTGGAAFTARPGTGTTSKLEVAGDGALSYIGDGNLYNGALPFNPQRFKLTTLDGRVLILDRSVGLVSETDRSGNTLSVDSSGIHASDGQSLIFARDSAGRIIQISGPSGQSLQYSYSPTGDLAEVVDATGNRSTFTYDGNHDLLSASGPAGTPFSSLQYDSSGRLISVTDGSGHTARISINPGAQQTVLTDPLGLLTTVYTYDALGDVVRRDQVAGGATLTTTATYDAVGHLTSATDPLGNTTSATYDASGNLLTLTDANGNTTSFIYDATGRPLTEVAPDGATATGTYDSAGLLVALRRPDGSTISYAYDSSGHPTTITDPSGQRVTLTYDASGRPASMTAATGQTSKTVYDASGQLVSLTDPLGNTTSFGRDGAERITSETDSRGGRRSYSYDFMGKVTSMTDPLGKTESFQFDGAGRLVQVIDRDGHVTSYVYDGDGHLVTRAPAGETATTLVYDDFGRVVHAANDTRRIDLSVDGRGRITSETDTGTVAAPFGPVTMTYAYDGVDNRTIATGPDGPAQYGYDVQGRLTSIIDPAGGRFDFGYDPVSRLVGISRPNGSTDALAYDGAGHLLSRTTSQGGSTVSSVGYVVDAVGRRTSTTDAGGTSTFTYDPSGQLTQATHPPAEPGPESYTYDAGGNRLSTATAAGPFQYDASNRLLNDGRFGYAYDSEGNLVAKTDLANGQVTTFDWNTVHELLAVHQPNGAVSSFGYDPFGRRVDLISPAGRTSYGYESDNVRTQFTNGALQASYTSAPVPDSVFETAQSGQRYYYLKDGLGSTTALADQSGALVQQYTYDAFGNQTSTGGVPNPFTFTGQELDAASGLYYDRARYYDPTTGRFISEDPVQIGNPYAYALNDPVNLVDPLGRQAIEEYETRLSQLRTEAEALCGAVTDIALAGTFEVLDALTAAAEIGPDVAATFAGPITRVTLTSAFAGVRFFGGDVGAVGQFFTTFDEAARLGGTGGTAVDALNLGISGNTAEELTGVWVEAGQTFYYGEIAGPELFGAEGEQVIFQQVFVTDRNMLKLVGEC